MPSGDLLAHSTEEVISDYLSGMTIEMVAEKYAISVGTVYNFLVRHGVSRRPRSTPLAWTEERRTAQRERARNIPSNKGRRYKLAHIKQIVNTRGAKHWNWKGGKTALILRIRTCPEYKYWRQQVYRRDNYTCVTCGVKRRKGHLILLNVDHIKPLALIIEEYAVTSLEEARSCSALWDIANGRVLCEDCHKQTPTYGVNIGRASDI